MLNNKIEKQTNFKKVKYGDRIAQMIIEKITPTILEETEDLDQTERGSGGFGSTGVGLKEADIQYMKVYTEQQYQEKNKKLSEL